MDSKSPETSMCLYRETRLSLEPPPTSKVVQLQLPTTNAFGRTSKVIRKVIASSPPSHDEEDFRKRHIATASSIFFRTISRYPRAILWRVLEANTVLELRAVDYSKSSKEKREEAEYITRFVFPQAIRTGGVALADSTDEDLLNVFVITKSNELYTFNLRPNFFCTAAASEDDFERWGQTCKPSSIATSNSYKLQASSSRELLVSLCDGRLARLVRKKGEDGSQWTESTYNDGQWGSSLRGLIRWQGNNSVRYEGGTLDQNTVVSVSTSPDREHIFGISLNHTLRVWNVATGKQTVSKDLLNIEREPQDVAKVMLNPSVATPLQIFESRSKSGFKYFVATFSPLGGGQFKIWGIRDAEIEDGGIIDLFDDAELRLPDSADEAMWTLSDFSLKSTPDSQELEVWILLRLNKRYKLFRRRLPNMDNLHEDWMFGWNSVAIDPVRHEPLNYPPTTISEQDCEDISSQWIKFLLTPGQIPLTVLNTALNIYAQTRDISFPKSSKISMSDKLSMIVASRIRLHVPGKDSTTEASLAQLRNDVLTEWNSFWYIVTDIDQLRWEPLSLSFDRHTDLPWIILTNGFSAVRVSAEIETLVDNQKDRFETYTADQRALVRSIEGETRTSAVSKSGDLVLLIEAAAKFRASFSSPLKVFCEDGLVEEMWTPPTHSVAARIQMFYDNCGFANEITDRQYTDLLSSLKDLGGPNALTKDLFLATVNAMSLEDNSKQTSHPFTAFGHYLLLRGSQDMIAIQSRVLTDLLFMAVFVDVDFDREEYPMKAFDAVPVYTTLLLRLREIRLCQWLSTSLRPDPRYKKDLTTSSNDTSTAAQSTIETTIFENLLIPKVNFNRDSENQSLALTNYIRDALGKAAAKGDQDVLIDDILISIQCDLLKNKNIELAASFQQFQPATAWATYIRGRLCLLRQEYDEAAIYFNKAAFKLSRPVPSADVYRALSFQLLDPATANFFASGLTNYHTHIANLFAELRVHPQVVSSAQLALQHSSTTTALTQRNDLLARLFHASLALTDFSTAYSALVRYTDRALQRAALASLVSAMAAHDAVDELLRFPFPTLQKDVDAWLVDKARAEAQHKARSGSTTPFFKILYAWRLRQGDFRGAAAVLVERLELQKRGRGSQRNGGEKALDEYLVGINALALVGDEDDGWVFADDGDGGKRRVVRLKDLREQYGKEMDRVSMMELGRFGIVGEDGDEDDEDGDVTMDG